MKNKILNNFIRAVLLILAFIFVFLITSLRTSNAKTDEIKTVVPIETIEVIEEDMYEIKSKEAMQKHEELLNIKDNKEYFIEYKKLIEKYSEWIDKPETIYDYFTEDELDLLFRVVEAEATAGGFNEKANIASVIFNRLAHDEFGDTLDKILVKSQFSPLRDGRAYKVEITEDTILACEYAFMIEDTTNGAIFFESKGSNIHDSYAEFLFQDGIGHKFYKEK